MPLSQIPVALLSSANPDRLETVKVFILQQKQSGSPVPQHDSWRAPLLEKLHVARLQAYYAADKAEEKRLQDLISSLVKN